MKKLFTFFTAILFAGILFAQSPQKLSYQAVIRDASNKLVVNHQVGMQISVVQSSEDGTVVYTETQTPSTNANGLVSIEIGGGAGFTTIDWANGPYFIKTETDPAGGADYTITGTNQLLSVPYALYAAKSGSPGPQGEKGDQGIQGPRGIQGNDGANGLTTSVNGVTQINGSITLTKSNIGLNNVDNTSDSNKPISSDTQTALNMKVDKVTGKGLSTEDYSTAERTKLAGIATGAQVNVKSDWTETDNTKDSFIENKPTLFTTTDETDPVYSISQAAAISNAGSGVVISSAERTKLAGIATGAQVNVKSDWTETDNTKDSFIENKPTLFTNSNETDPVYAASQAASITNAGSGVVISSAERTKLAGIATGAQVNVKSDWAETNNTKDSFIENKPTLFTNSNETDPVYDASQAASITNAGSGVVISNAERTKLTGIAEGAEVNVQADWNAVSGDAQILNKPALFTTANETDPVYSISQAASITDAGSGMVISSAERTKLTGIAEGAEVNVQADWNAVSGDAQILNKPAIPAAANGSETKVTAGTNVTVTGAGTTASPYVVNATGVTSGTVAGQMQYWNGSAWVAVAPGSNGAVLTYFNGVPKWLMPGQGETDVYNPATGKLWMDRNLGASQVATSSTDAAAFGDLYQWGRAADGHQARNSATTTVLSAGDVPGHSNFIIMAITGNPGDWRSTRNDNLWQGVNGMNNPCPSGYRLPTEAEWNAERTSWSSNNSAGAFASPLKLSTATNRLYWSGAIGSTPNNGYYWSSNGSNLSPSCMFFYESNAFITNTMERAYGQSVRCIKD